MGTVGRVMWDLVFPPGPPDRIADMFATAVVSDAVRRHDADLAQWVETCRDWRRGYREVFRAMTALAVSSPAASRGMADDGLRAVRAVLRFTAGRTVAPLEAVDLSAIGAGAVEFDTERVAGEAKPVARLEVPWRGGVLAGEPLRRQLRDWQHRGVVEPGFAAAVERVIDHPEWLSLPGFRVALVGAAAELGPLQPLLRWGAEVLAVDLPGRLRWQSLREQARAGAGVLWFPRTADRPGADVAGRLPGLANWLAAHTGSEARPVLGLHASTPGPAGVRLAAASDLLTDIVLRHRPDTALAYLGSPFDCYAVPHEVVTAARERVDESGFGGLTRKATRLLTRSALWRPGYRREIPDAEGAPWGIVDLLLSSLGPHHALTHRLPRWRALSAHATGTTVSYTVPPLAWTRATTRTTWLAASYQGLTRRGIEIFDPDTARTLLAAKLVADLVTPPTPPPEPGVPLHLRRPPRRPMAPALRTPLPLPGRRLDRPPTTNTPPLN
ncbi:hypothetical protein [Nocardia transvalensis]|uniref:hypothetical protein n=1 Tax=Nocardia transvalensis TaxID=37333 RepID=UPI00189366A7|nr:hypothetical protein [Nocardia transvalensis]MBF6333793.1 hypothetical protein [Nocardia transvalensis]